MKIFRLRNAFKITVLTLLVVSVSATLVSEYLYDIFGISLPGIYICEAKTIAGGYLGYDIPLDGQYLISEIQAKSEKVGYKTQVNAGFGEPDNQGAGILILTSTPLAKYRFALSRNRDSNWKKIDLTIMTLESTNRNNICTTPRKRIQQDVKNVISPLGIDTKWIKSVKIEKRTKIPWYNPLLF